MKVVYTALFGSNADQLHDVVQTNRTAFVCFADRPVTAKGWEVLSTRYCPPNATPRLLARLHKINSTALFPAATVTLWVDSTHAPITSVEELTNEYLSHHSVATFKHPLRDCVYAEIYACAGLGKDTRPNLLAHRQNLLEMNYPADNGLAETSVMLRRNNATTRKLEQEWAKQLLAGSERDQLSFDPACYLTDTPYAHIRGHRTSSEHFHYRPHARALTH